MAHVGKYAYSYRGFISVPTCSLDGGSGDGAKMLGKDFYFSPGSDNSPRITQGIPWRAVLERVKDGEV